MVDAARMVVRLELQSTCGELLDEAVGLWDNALVVSWAQFKRIGMAVQDWTEIYRSILALILDMDAVGRILPAIAAKTTVNVASEVALVAGSSKIGARLCEDLAVDMVGGRLGNFVEDAL